MPVPVMQIRPVRVAVRNRFMFVPVGVPRVCFGVCVLVFVMVIVVAMSVFMREWLVRVFMTVLVSEQKQ